MSAVLSTSAVCTRSRTRGQTYTRALCESAELSHREQSVTDGQGRVGCRQKGLRPCLPLRLPPLTRAWILHGPPLYGVTSEACEGALSGDGEPRSWCGGQHAGGPCPWVTVWGAVGMAVGAPSVGGCWARGTREGVGRTFPRQTCLGSGRGGWGAGSASWPRSQPLAPPPQRRSWSPTRTPRPSSCQARASRWTWTQSARTSASTSTFSISATSCAACRASLAPAERPPGLRASRCRGCSSGAPATWGAPLSPSLVHRSGLSALSSPQGLHHAGPEGHPEAQSFPPASRDPSGGAREAGLEHPLPPVGGPRAQGPPGRPPGRPSRGGPQAADPHGDPSCLLTPPGTPLGLEPAAPDWPEGGSACGRVLPEGRRTGSGGPRGTSREGEPGPASQLPQGPSPAESGGISGWAVSVTPERLSPWTDGPGRGLGGNGWLLMCVQPRSQCEARGLGGWGSGGPGALGACVLRPLAGLRAVGGRLMSRRCSAELGGCPAGRVRGQGCARGRTPLRWAARLGPWGGPAIWVGSSRATPQEGQTGITAGGGVGEEVRPRAEPPLSLLRGAGSHGSTGGLPAPAGFPWTFRSQCPLEQLSRTWVLDVGQTLDRGLSGCPSPTALSASTGDCAAPEDEPPPAPSSRSSSTDDFCYMFVVELERGPSGLGMGLIDGMVSGRPVRSGLLSPPDRPTAGGSRRGGEARDHGDRGRGTSWDWRARGGAMGRVSHLHPLPRASVLGPGRNGDPRGPADTPVTTAWVCECPQPAWGGVEVPVLGPRGRGPSEP